MKYRNTSKFKETYTNMCRNVQLAERRPIKGKTNANLNSNKCDIAHPTTACFFPDFLRAQNMVRVIEGKIM